MIRRGEGPREKGEERGRGESAQSQPALAAGHDAEPWPVLKAAAGV